METVETGAEPVKRERDLVRVYRTVNEAWGRARHDLPELTYAEARTAIRRLCKFAGLPLKPGITFKPTSGNRYTWVRRSVYHVNAGRGWWHLVHDVAHRLHDRLHPGKRPHDASEAYLERHLIEHVVQSGWLDGTLKRPEKAPKPDLKAQRHARALAKLSAWQRKKKRAETAIKKLSKTVRDHERLAA